MGTNRSVVARRKGRFIIEEHKETFWNDEMLYILTTMIVLLSKFIEPYKKGEYYHI